MEYRDLVFNHLDKILNCWMLLDKEGDIVYWSDSAKHQFGYESGEIQHTSFTRLLPDSYTDKGQFLESLVRSAHAGSVVNRKVLLRRKNDVIMDVMLSMHILNQNSTDYYLFSMDNITEVVELQKLVGARMEEIHRQFHSYDHQHLTSTIRDVFDAVLVSVTAGQGLKFNRAFLLLIDQKKNVIKGVQAIGPGSKEKAGVIYNEFYKTPKTLKEMIKHYKATRMTTDNTVTELIQNIQVCLTEKDHIFNKVLENQKYQLINNESPYVNDPSVIELRRSLEVDECILVPLVWHGRPTGLIIADNQITNQKITSLNIQGLTGFVESAVNAIESVKLLENLEDSFEQIKKAHLKIRESQALIVQKEKLAAKGQLVAQMAHEVRGPLSIIGGFARRVFKKTPEEASTYDSMKRIVDTVSTLELVLSDILDSSHKKQPPNACCDSVILINKVTGLLEEEIRKREISMKLNMQGDLPKIKIGEHHLFEIINNLVKNAIEAIEQKGLLSISSERKGNNRVQITIQDNGPGLTLKTQENMFSPFFTTKKEGTGLGLVVVKKLVDEHDGTIDVQSLPGVGTTFTITFPTE